MPDLPLFELPRSRKDLRVASFFASLGIHFVLVGLMLAAHTYLPDARRAPLSDRAVVREHKVIWYTPNTELPPVAPLEPESKTPGPPKVVHPRQNIAATAKKPESRSQMVLQPAPQLRLEHDIESPNMLVFNPPPVATPKPKPRFVPAALRRPAPRPEPLPDVPAPEVAAAPNTIPLPAEPSRVTAPRFEPRQPKREITRAVLAADAPEVAAPAVAANGVVRLAVQQPVEAPRFVVPQGEPGRAQPARPVLSDASAPGIAAAPQPTTVAALNGVAEPVSAPRFVVPERSGAAGAPSRPVLPSDGAAPDVAGARQPATAVVGLNPVPAPITPPPGSRSASFSAGPDSKPGAGDSAPPTVRAEVRLPDLAIAPALSPATVPAPEPALPPPSISRPPLPNADRAAVRRQLFASLPTRASGGLSSPARPRGPGGPEIVLHGATVYTMAIDMPNITSHDGSWTLRFTEIGGSSPDDLLTAPTPTHKVDPKYVAAAADEGVEGKVLLYAVIRRDGRVDQIRLVQSLDERLDSSAVSAFSKWEFQPAMKDGQPVDLEAVVQIPFRLAHRAKR